MTRAPKKAEVDTPGEHAAVTPVRTPGWLAWTEVGFTLWLYYLLLVAAIAVPPFVVPAMGFRLNLRQGTAVTLGGTLLAELVAAGLLLWWLRRRRLSLADVGFVRPSPRVAPLVVAGVFGLLYAAWTMLIPEVRANATEFGPLKLWGLAVSLVAAVMEEAVFRGFIMNELAHAGRSRAVQVIVSAVTFGLLHLGWGWWGMACTLMMGAALAVTYLWAGRSLAAPVLGHCVINAIIEPWLLLYVITVYARMFGGG